MWKWFCYQYPSPHTGEINENEMNEFLGIHSLGKEWKWIPRMNENEMNESLHLHLSCKCNDHGRGAHTTINVWDA